MTSRKSLKLWLGAALIAAPLSFAQAGESSWYAGGSVGSATTEVAPFGGGAPEFNEDDMGWKAVLGYNFGMTPVFDLGIEGGYVDFGAPTGDVGGIPAEASLTGWDIFGLIGFDIGPVGLYGKVGYFAWDGELIIGGLPGEDSGSDLAYGAGIRFNVGAVEIRAEYELFDVEVAEELSMASVGVMFHF